MKRFVLSSLMIAGLAACGQTTTTTPVVDTTAKAPEILGFAVITFDNANTANPTISVRTSSIEAGLAGLKSQDLSRPAKIVISQTSVRGGIQDPATTHRWMYGKLNVTNNSTTMYKNVTLLGVNVPGYHKFDTSLTDAFVIGGGAVTASKYRDVIPTNPRYYNDFGVFGVPPLLADYQMYSEAYVQNITNFMAGPQYGGTAFPYGFVARAPNSSTSRDIAPGANTGQVTVAFATPDTTAEDVNGDIKTFTFVGLITADAVTTVSADVYEASSARACAAAALITGGSTVNSFTGQPTGGCGENNIASLRTSGTQATPTTTITYASHP